MNRKPVRSSNICSIGYDSKSQTLEREFHSGRVYQYFNVPEIIYITLMSATSHGSYFNHKIKDKYPCREVK